MSVAMHMTTSQWYQWSVLVHTTAYSGHCSVWSLAWWQCMKWRDKLLCPLHCGYIISVFHFDLPVMYITHLTIEFWFWVYCSKGFYETLSTSRFVQLKYSQSIREYFWSDFHHQGKCCKDQVELWMYTSAWYACLAMLLLTYYQSHPFSPVFTSPGVHFHCKVSCIVAASPRHETKILTRGSVVGLENNVASFAHCLISCCTCEGAAFCMAKWVSMSRAVTLPNAVMMKMHSWSPSAWLQRCTAIRCFH